MGGLDVTGLGTLVAGTKQHDHGNAGLCGVDSIARPMVDPQLEYGPEHWAPIAAQAGAWTVYALDDPCPGGAVV